MKDRTASDPADAAEPGFGGGDRGGSIWFGKGRTRAVAEHAMKGNP